MRPLALTIVLTATTLSAQNAPNTPTGWPLRAGDAPSAPDARAAAIEGRTVTCPCAMAAGWFC